MKGRLLNYVESFNWSDKDKNRSLELQNYNSALIKARDKGDHVYCPEAMYNPENINIIFQFIWVNGYHSYEQLKVHFDWMSVEDFQVLTNLSHMLGNYTPNSSNTWKEFNAEFLDENKSLIGFKQEHFNDPLVYDEPTYKSFHSKFVSTFDYPKQKLHYKYFKEHYFPILKKDSGQIKGAIDKKQVNSGIIRLDPPKTSPSGEIIHNQQIHVHFKIGKNEYALNIDGTWKHGPKPQSKVTIPTDMCNTFCEWGFLLPDEYYS
ncbi:MULTISPECIES: hypothetical protein [Sphingobacterium]|uniref:hypothetical protein n=1 Tax=Sphingobacterium TaxID=28453 RepID=UPI000DAFA899|nr:MULTISPECIES: hypothetical protein [Sphingobacterium]PZU25982.1 MAG: hypothetical protein DI622_01905 [Chryseobacterium sp.]